MKTCYVGKHTTRQNIMARNGFVLYCSLRLPFLKLNLVVDVAFSLVFKHQVEVLICFDKLSKFKRDGR